MSSKLKKVERASSSASANASVDVRSDDVELVERKIEELTAMLKFSDVKLGKLARGAVSTDKYKFGDNTRSVCAATGNRICC